MLRWVLVVLAASFGSPVLGATCAPANMVRVGTVDATPGLDPNAYSAKPRTVHRLGRLFARIDESPDPANGMHRLTVIREPDVWTVNRTDKTGEHMLDPGPVFEVRAPLFGNPGLPPLFHELELGCELDFIDAYAPTPQGKVKVGGASLVKHQMSIGAQRIEFLIRPAPAKGGGRKVYSVGLYIDEAPRSVIRYLSYDIGLPANMTLFERPKGIRYTEGSTLPAQKPAAPAG